MELIRSTLDLESRVLVMGVLNVTPDSFSDGGKYADLEGAAARALEIEAEGADILDVGGESTRPGSKLVSVEEESGVARAALQAGAEIINDVSGLRFDPAVADVAAETGAALALMHSRGAPGMMHQQPPVADVFAEVIGGLRRAIDEALRRGAPSRRRGSGLETYGQPAPGSGASATSTCPERLASISSKLSGPRNSFAIMNSVRRPGPPSMVAKQARSS